LLRIFELEGSGKSFTLKRVAPFHTSIAAVSFFTLSAAGLPVCHQPVAGSRLG
jgi:hypothetical protein